MIRTLNRVLFSKIGWLDVKHCNFHTYLRKVLWLISRKFEFEIKSRTVIIWMLNLTNYLLTKKLRVTCFHGKSLCRWRFFHRMTKAIFLRQFAEIIQWKKINGLKPGLIWSLICQNNHGKLIHMHILKGMYLIILRFEVILKST